MKQYKAIFFDWDGTAVLSRTAPVDDVVKPMKQLLKNGVKLAIISGTTIENIAKGKLHEYFTTQELESLFLGLGRGAFNYCYKDGQPSIFKGEIPQKADLLKIHDICYQVHRELLDKYGIATDIVFSRPNYCKIDLMVENDRGNALFFQENELSILKERLESHGFMGGLKGLIQLAEEMGKKNDFSVRATTDAKYLEVGISDKSNNVNTILNHFEKAYGIKPEECSFWGDEFISMDKSICIEEGIFGSDSFMITEQSKTGDFFDVSEATGDRPSNVVVLGGGVSRFISFLEEQV